ncbi:MAG: bifunctional diaminohydroxyphosphoribosylaminopyrimidine deaminase/5-amino-6-(5-phosphoribosylamino)uracil reductase RibD [Pseudomonadota bacterium]
MDAALALARRGLGLTWPNPSVGCVLVRPDAQGGRLIARAVTQQGGRPHAEAAALAEAGDAARGATAYVTLEPCAHQGATPPCADTLVSAGVARVVSAIEDPDPRVAGRGHARLRTAGVDVLVGVRAAEAAEANQGHLLRIRAGRPLVTLKLATTLDGKIATESGESQWISDAPARARAHLLRATHDAILVGAGTVRADDPRLDVRLSGLAGASPVAVAADGGLTTPLDGALAKGLPQRAFWILHRADADRSKAEALAALGAQLIETPARPDGRLDLRAALLALGARGVTRVLCEGGGQMAAALLSAGLVDRLVWVAAGAAIGSEGRPAVGPLGLLRLAEAPRFRLRRQERIGPDLLSEWTPVQP